MFACKNWSHKCVLVCTNVVHRAHNNYTRNNLPTYPPDTSTDQIREERKHFIGRLRYKNIDDDL